jgi:hypothetical protein
MSIELKESQNVNLININDKIIIVFWSIKPFNLYIINCI